MRVLVQPLTTEERAALADAVRKVPRPGIDSAPSGAPAWREVPNHRPRPDVRPVGLALYLAAIAKGR
ncbi:hypothetical protein AB0K68_35970 [Streptomyces sp. NPDC050698]